MAKYPADSPYTFFNLARTYHVDKNCRESEAVWLDNFTYRHERDEKWRADAAYLDTYVKEIFAIMEQYGFRFFEDCNLELCYHSIHDAIVNRKGEQYMDFYLEYKNDFDAYYKLNGKEIATPNIQAGRKSWLQKLVSLIKRN